MGRAGRPHLSCRVRIIALPCAILRTPKAGQDARITLHLPPPTCCCPARYVMAVLPSTCRDCSFQGQAPLPSSHGAELAFPFGRNAASIQFATWPAFSENGRVAGCVDGDRTRLHLPDAGPETLSPREQPHLSLHVHFLQERPNGALVSATETPSKRGRNSAWPLLVWTSSRQADAPVQRHQARPAVMGTAAPVVPWSFPTELVYVSR